MKNNEFLKDLIKFYDNACNCKVVLEGKRVIPKYKSTSTLDIKNVNQAFSKLGFRHIRVRKYINGNYVWHMLGTEKMQLKELLYDISCRFEYYSSIRRKLCSTLKKYTEDEIIAFLNVANAIISELEIFDANVADKFGMTDEQRLMFNSDKINQFNSLLVSYLLGKIKSYKKSKVYDNNILSGIYDYSSFNIFCTSNPFDMIELGEITVNGKTVFGLKLKEKDITLVDFLEDLSSSSVVDILYKKSYGDEKSYLDECLKSVYCIALGLEMTI